MADALPWRPIPFHFWSVFYFMIGSMAGSFLNVCIHRMPRGESVVRPPSHCPHCGGIIPWFLNIPLVTWLYLRGRCAFCQAKISARYWLVELLTALLFLFCWLAYGAANPWLAIIYALFLAGLVAATFIDFEHFIIPDEITLGGAVAGFVVSFFVPALHDAATAREALLASAKGIIVGGLLVYGILRLGKLLFGVQRYRFTEPTVVIFSETAVHLPGLEIPFDEIFYRQTDTIRLQGLTVEMPDRCQRDAAVQLSPKELQVGEETFAPETVPYLEVRTHELILPREAMGLGDVKFMMAIGAFLGWRAVIFSLMLSAVIGSIVGVTLIVMQRREWSSRVPYGPYIAVAAAIWIFAGEGWLTWWLARMSAP